MKDKAVFITGASSGIGRETAYLFARDGARLAITYCRSKERGEETEKRCRELGASDVLLLHLDVTDTESIRRAVTAVGARFGQMDVLINNAGTGVWKPFGEQSMEELEWQVRTNLEGLIKLTSMALPLVRETVLSIGSFLAKNPMAGYVPYCGTKYGVRGFMQALAREVEHVKVCLVNPDYTATGLTGFDPKARPAADVAEVVYKTVTGEIECGHGGEVDVWEVLG
jgi:NAD(P)-dependent dehydrogenase (short-subunit alcohol dehydrogenase family)